MPAPPTESNRPGLERLWERHLKPGEFLRWLPLAPAAGVYRAALAARNRYWRGRAKRAKVFTVSIGNLTVGGSGKTPFALFLAARLAEHGLRPAIVSRGYGRKSGKRAAIVANAGSLRVTPEEAGDEPAMMSKSFGGPIAVARRRIDAIELVERETDSNAIILDDAFQHVRLVRDLDLVMVNVTRGFGNGWLLPAGPMREPLSAGRRADAIILVSSGVGQRSRVRESQMEQLGHRSLRAAIRPHALVKAENGKWSEMPPTLAGRRVLAVSGLADPSAFYTMLRELDADLVGVLEYADHHRYTPGDWHAIVAAARNTDLVVTTEKDLVKLERFPFERDSLAALRVEIRMSDEDLRALDELLMSRVNRAHAAGPDPREVRPAGV